MARVSEDVATARAGFFSLLDDDTPNPPVELREHVLELARLLKQMRAFNDYEWADITARVRAKFDIDVVDHVTSAVDPEFATEIEFESLVTDGWFRAYLDYTRESEAPAQFHFGAALACVSGAMGRRPLIGWEAAPLFPNIYALLVGPTGTRKSTAINKAREVAVQAFPEALNVLPNEGSPQGYASALMQRNLLGSPIADGLGIASELTVLVGRETYKEALGKWLTDWYDNMGDKWTRALKGEATYELVKPYVCFIGASNMTWLRELPESLIKAGYMPRHLVFNALEKRHDAANPQFDDVDRMVLVGLLQERVRDLPETMTVGADAVMYMNRWYLGRVTKQERQEQDELFAAWLSRKLPHALKIACIWQIVDGGPKDELQGKWLRRAARLVDWMDAGVMDVYRALGTTGEGLAVDAVTRCIEKRGGSIQLTALQRTLRNKYSAESVRSAIRTLVVSGLVKSEADAVGVATLTLVKR